MDIYLVFDVIGGIQQEIWTIVRELVDYHKFILDGNSFSFSGNSCLLKKQFPCNFAQQPWHTTIVDLPAFQQLQSHVRMEYESHINVGLLVFGLVRVLTFPDSTTLNSGLFDNSDGFAPHSIPFSSTTPMALRPRGRQHHTQFRSPRQFRWICEPPH